MDFIFLLLYILFFPEKDKAGGSVLAFIIQQVGN